MVRLRCVIYLIAVAADLFAVTSPIYAQTIDSHAAIEIINERGVDPLAGIWRTGTEGAIIAFLPVRGETQWFDIVMLDSHDMSVIPGQTIGHAFATGVIGVYDATFNKSSFNKKVRVIMTLEKDLRLTFKQYKKHLSLSLWRLLPYVFRNPVKKNDTRPTEIDGAVRLYPAAVQEGPVML